MGCAVLPLRTNTVRNGPLWSGLWSIKGAIGLAWVTPGNTPQTMKGPVMTAVLSPADASAKLLDVRAVAEMLGCSARHVYRLSDAGKMPGPLRLGSLVRWSKTAIETWIDQGCPPARSMKGAGR